MMINNTHFHDECQSTIINCLRVNYLIEAKKLIENKIYKQFLQIQIQIPIQVPIPIR